MTLQESFNMKKNSRYLSQLLAVVFAFSFSQSQAATIDLVLSSDLDPLTVTGGEQITFTVGITPLEVITGYTLDIRYDQSELDFVSSAQLVPFFMGKSVYLVFN